MSFYSWRTWNWKYTVKLKVKKPKIPILVLKSNENSIMRILLRTKHSLISNPMIIIFLMELVNNFLRLADQVKFHHHEIKLQVSCLSLWIYILVSKLTIFNDMWFWYNNIIHTVNARCLSPWSKNKFSRLFHAIISKKSWNYLKNIC